MRLTFTDEEFYSTLEALKKVDIEMANLLLNKKIEYSNSVTPTKRNATKKATNTKVKNTKDKIINALNLMRLEGKTITSYTLAKESGCSFNTCKKYEHLFHYNTTKREERAKSTDS